MASKADGGINMQPHQIGHELLRLYYAAAMNKNEYLRRCEERTKLCSELRLLQLTPEEKQRSIRTPAMISTYRSASSAEHTSDIQSEDGIALERASTVAIAAQSLSNNAIQQIYAMTVYNRSKNHSNRICEEEIMRLTLIHADGMRSLSVQDGLSGSKDSIADGKRDVQFRIECLENDAKVQEVERKLEGFQENAEWEHLLGELINQGIFVNTVASLTIALEDEKVVQDFCDRLLDTNLDDAIPGLHKRVQIHLPDAHPARGKNNILQVLDSSLGRVAAVKNIASMASGLPTKAPGVIPGTWSAGTGAKTASLTDYLGYSVRLSLPLQTAVQNPRTERTIFQKKQTKPTDW